MGGQFPASFREDENRDVFRQVQQRTPPGARICCLTLAVHSFQARAFCPYALNLMALQNRQSTDFGYPWNFRDLSEGYRLLVSQRYNFVLLDIRDAASGVPPYKLQNPSPD